MQVFNSADSSMQAASHLSRDTLNPTRQEPFQHGLLA